MDYGYSNNNQYSTTSYGAQGGGGGGGFMNDTSGSQGAGTGAGKRYEEDTLRPVTIKQLVDAQQPHPDADFKVDGTQITHVTFVGQIRNISTQATNHTYKIDDGTGTIEVKQYIDPDAASSGDPNDVSSGKPKLTENAYARVWGRLKVFNNKRHVGVQVIRPITDYNEVQYHLLEATVVHLHFSRGPPGGQKGATGGNGVDSYGQQQDGYGAAASDGRKQLPAGLSVGARKVYGCLQTSPQSNEGLHAHDIANRLSMQVGDVGRAAEELNNMGLVYTTVDDQTWAILDDLAG